MNSAPIGVFDSGLGGLTVWSELRRTFPNESLLYFGDGKNCPYGNMSREEMIPLVDAAVQEMLARGVKMIVVACNAATALTIDHLRAAYAVPFVGLEPAVKPAAETTRSGVVGVLATAAALCGSRFVETSRRYADRVKIIPAVGEGFVELVEGNLEDTPEALEAVRRVLEPVLREGADCIVLGCTHYPFLAAAMHKVIGDRDVRLIDSAAAIARRAGMLLATHDLQAPPENVPQYEFLTAANETYRQRLMAKAEQAHL